MIKFPRFRSARAAAAPTPAATLTVNLAAAAPAVAAEPTVTTRRLPVCAPALVHGPLAVYPLLRPAPSAAEAVAAASPAATYQSLTAALADGRARLHESDGLRETEVENLTDTDLFLGAGETVTGIWQDWTLGVDLILPRRSSRHGRLALRGFCRGPGRWRCEATDRREVSRALAPAAAVPASERALAKLPRTQRSGAAVVGFALAVHGAPCAAHLYATADLFTVLWPGILERLLSSGGSVVVAAGGRRKEHPPEAGLMSAWLARACRTAAASVGDAYALTPRVTLLGRPADAEGSAARLVSLETLDNARGGLCVHQAIVPGTR